MIRKLQPKTTDNVTVYPNWNEIMDKMEEIKGKIAGLNVRKSQYIVNEFIEIINVFID